MTTTPTPAPARDRRMPRRLLFGVSALVLIGVIVAGYWYLNLGPGRASPPGSVVAEFSGDDNQTTESFSVRPGWRIDWENEGDQFSFAIRGDREFGIVVEQQEPGSGITSPTGGGTHYLDIVANGPWSVTVFQGD